MKHVNDLLLGIFVWLLVSLVLMYLWVFDTTKVDTIQVPVIDNIYMWQEVYYIDSYDGIMTGEVVWARYTMWDETDMYGEDSSSRYKLWIGTDYCGKYNEQHTEQGLCYSSIEYVRRVFTSKEEAKTFLFGNK